MPMNIQGLICKELKRQDKLPEKWNDMAMDISLEYKFQNYNTGTYKTSGYIEPNSCYILRKFVGGEQVHFDLYAVPWTITRKRSMTPVVSKNNYVRANLPKFLADRDGYLYYKGVAIGCANPSASSWGAATSTALVPSSSAEYGWGVNVRSISYTLAGSGVDYTVMNYDRMVYTPSRNRINFQCSPDGISWKNLETVDSIGGCNSSSSKSVIIVTNYTNLEGAFCLDDFKFEYNGEVVLKGKNM